MTGQAPFASPGSRSDEGLALGRTSRRGARSSVLTQLLTQAGSIAATVILARLLTPGEFGVVALTYSILGVGSLLSLSGITAALVTRRGDIDVAASSYFWVTVVVTVFVSGVLVALADPLSSALGQPSATPYVRVAAMAFPLTVLVMVPNAILQREFRFGLMNASMLTSSFIYFALEVLLAYLGYGAWSVIVAGVAGALAAIVFSMVAARWMPGPNLSWDVVREDLRVVSGLGVGQVFTYVWKNADYWATSTFVGGSALGVYYVAYVLPNIIRLRISSVVRQVMLPAYATATSRDDVAALWRRTSPLMLGLALPALVGIALVADPLVGVFFGDQWHGAVWPLRILACVAAVDLYFASVGTVAIAQRRIRRLLQVWAFRAGVTCLLAFAAVAVWASIAAVALAVAAATILSLLLLELLIGRPLGVGLKTVREPLWRYGLATGVMAVVVVVTVLVMSVHLPAVVQLGALSTVGVVTYGAFGWLFLREDLRITIRDARLILSGH